MQMPETTLSCGQDRFAADTVEVIGAVRDVYARVIEENCPGSKAVSAVSSAFGIHRKLAWQLIKVAYAEDAFVAAKHMPSSKSVDALVRAAKLSGVAEELIASIRETDERFQALIDTHASSKPEFDMLIESTYAVPDSGAEDRWRQQAFEGNSFTWGAHCKMLLAMCVLMPSEDREHFFHAAQIRGIMGFCQTRPGVRWVINQSVALDDDAQHEQAMQRVAIDPASAEAYNGVPVLSEFCSDPMPALQRSLTPEGMMQDEFLSSEIGLLGERTLVTGEMLRNIAPTHAMPNDKIAHFGTTVRTPAEMLHFDLFVHDGLFGDVERELCVFSDLASHAAFQDSDRLQIAGEVKKLGRGLDFAQSVDLPGYPSIARSVFERLGHNPDEFELFRVRMAYPPMPTSVMFRHELLPKDR
jgi:hypothetical protein